MFELFGVEHWQGVWRFQGVIANYWLRYFISRRQGEGDDGVDKHSNQYVQYNALAGGPVGVHIYIPELVAGPRVFLGYVVVILALERVNFPPDPRCSILARPKK